MKEKLFPFQLDEFQKKALKSIEKGHSLIVSAPTGAGKTVIAEYVIHKCLEKGLGVVYCAPIKALSNQKYRDFKERYGQEKIGILTGDVSINVNAPVLIMTTEIFRNTILDCPWRLEDKFWVIFDEIHYIDDVERGTVWEESIIMLPSHMRLLGLSATIPNLDELADWIKTIHNFELDTIIETHRPVPLEHRFQCHNKIYTSLSKLKQECYPWMSNKAIIRGWDKGYVPNKVISLIKHIQQEDLLPCLYFAFSRRRCEILAWELRKMNFLSSDEKKDILDYYYQLLYRFNLIGDKFAEDMRNLIERGIAFHHAGMLPTMKEVIELLFTSKMIKVIFTTETFALGINMPARTVVFDELRKYYGTHFGELRTRDFYQMAGRAGRRGIDEKGYVYSRINPQHIDFPTLKRIIFGKPERVVSQFNLSYACILHLYKDLKDELVDIYPKSFAFYQSSQRQHRQDLRLIRSKIKLLKQLGYINKNQLTNKGIFASYIYGYELPITELYASGFINSLSYKELLALVCAIVFEPRKGQHKPMLPKNIKRLQKVANKQIRRIIRMEKKQGILPLTKRAHFHLSLAIVKWAEGEDFERLNKYTDADPGEIVRYFRMVIQVLKDINEAPLTDSGLKEKIDIAIKKINRDQIDAERQLRA